MAAMAGNSRNRDFSTTTAAAAAAAAAAASASLNSNPDHERSSFNSMPWANSIWNNKPIGSAFAPPSRDGSNTFAGASADPSDAKTGSGSLVSSSDTEWRPARQSQAWGDNSNVAHARSSGASPARKRSIAQAQAVQQYADASPASFFPASRTHSIGHAGAIPLNPHLDPTSSNFTSSRHIDSLNTGFASFGFGQAENSPQRNDPTWQDAGSVHSPSDDRRSATASDHFETSSGAPSRNGSLPPSRHGAETGQYNPYADSFARYAQPAPRQGSSLSHAVPRPFQERSGSIQSESWQTLAQLKLEQEQQDARMLQPRSSLSANAFTPAFTPAHDVGVSRDSYQDPLPAAHTDSPAYRNSGTYTPDSYNNGQVNDNVQFRSVQYDGRSASTGSGARQSPFYSHSHTPPVHDYLNPTSYRNDQGLSHPNGIALVQNKLAGYQIQQERRNIASPQFYQQQYQHIMPVAQLRNPHAYQYAMSNGMPMTALPPHMTMVQMSPMMSGVEPPRGPRVQLAADNIGAMSLVLDAFKKESKQNKRWELTDIYENVVEFAGDQHGSRFIQQKLETANSEVKDRVFKELEKNALQLMQDVFGNYVIQKFFEHGDQTQKRIMASKMKGHVLALSNQMYACRVVQKALEHVLVDQQASMVKELEKDVLKTVKDQNGNHVIQRVVERVPIEYIQPIVDAFRDHIDSLSTNSYGCRVIQRLVEKIPEPQRRFILTELHAAGPKLITDSYGNYVVQHVIEHGLPEDRAKMIALVRNQFLMFSKHKFASNVVERCLVCGSDEQRRELVATVITKNDRGENNLLNLLKDGYGNYVIQKLLETLGREDYLVFVAELKPELEKAKKIISGKQIVSVEKKMYRFDRVDSPTMPREDVPPTPALSSTAQSPDSSTLPSAAPSTTDGAIDPSPTKELSGPPGGIEISEHLV